MDDSCLNVTEAYVEECKITQMEYHSFLPYSTTALSNNDEIKICIQNMELYTLPCESYIYIEGNITKPNDSDGKFTFTNNGLAFLFSEMRYELNGTEIQKLKSPGISSSLKGLCSYAPKDLRVLANAAWDISKDSEPNQDFIENFKFSGYIPLKHVFGFCEDYNKILLSSNQQLILNRASTDYDALFVSGTEEKMESHNKVKIELTKILWKMPILKVSDKEKLKLIKVLDSRKPITCAFRTWDLCEYPCLPSNISHSWTVKSSNLLEKPRYVIIGFQTKRKNNLLRHSGKFDSCYLKNLKVYLNSEVYPYEDFRLNFTNRCTSTLYKAYTDFQISYYGRDGRDPLLSKSVFDKDSPIVVVDLSRQNDNVKSSTCDLRLEFEMTESAPANTAAYCLILHDQVITYNPFNGDVRKM